MADRGLTGVLLVGGASTRFGSPKALARLDGETLAERAWRVLGEACDERIAVGKAADGLELPFALLDDGTEIRAPIAGVVAGLRAAPTDVSRGAAGRHAARDARAAPRARRRRARDVAVPQTRPAAGRLPARRRCPRSSARLAAGELALRDAIAGLDAAMVELDAALLVNVNTPDELRRL